MKNLSKWTLMCLIAAAAALSSCQKEVVEEALNIQSSKDHSRSENYWNDIYSISDDIAGNTNGIKSMNFPCVDTVIVDTLSNPMTMLIDFGAENCMGLDGRYRRGEIFITFTGRYRDPGTVITITPQNFYINDHHVEGTKTISNMGMNEEGHPYFTIEIEDAGVTAPDESWQTSHESSRIRTWVEGSETFARWDDVYEITGTANGVNRQGYSYSMQTLEAIVVKLSCPWIVAGVIEITPENGPIRTVDYGEGECDNEVTVTVNGNEYYFEM